MATDGSDTTHDAASPTILRLTGRLRFERRPYTYTESTAPPDPMHRLIGKTYAQVERIGYRYVLQQEWAGGDDVRWIDVPTVDALAVQS